MAVYIIFLSRAGQGRKLLRLRNERFTAVEAVEEGLVYLVAVVVEVYDVS